MTAPGGIDVKLKWVPTSNELGTRVKVLWPQVVARVPPVFGRGLTDEILYYENPHAEDDWDKNGATDENADTMTHALWTREPAECWLVVGSKESPIAKHLLGEWT